MVKSSASNSSDSLVDLACRDGVDIRPTLLRMVTDLYVQKPIHGAEEEAQFVELALGLVEAVDAQTRATVTATLSAHPAAPAAVLRKLAGMSSSGAAATGEPDQNDLINLFFSASPEERTLILINLDVASGTTTHRPLPIGSELLRRLENAALKNNPGEFSRVLERALGVSRELADKITRDNSGESIVVVAKAIGLKAELLPSILVFLNPAIGQSTHRLYELSRLFDKISPASAEYMLTIWRTSVRRRLTHESVYWSMHTLHTETDIASVVGENDGPRLRYKGNKR